MKYLITENRLNNLILDYIKDYYDWDKVTLEPDETDEGNAFFYLPEIGDIFFYNGDDSGLDIMYPDFYLFLSGMFNDRWIPVFIQFIEDEFNIKVLNVYH